jgi:hypothetical protein
MATSQICWRAIAGLANGSLPGFLDSRNKHSLSRRVREAFFGHHKCYTPAPNKSQQLLVSEAGELLRQTFCHERLDAMIQILSP